MEEMKLNNNKSRRNSIILILVVMLLPVIVFTIHSRFFGINMTLIETESLNVLESLRNTDIKNLEINDFQLKFNKKRFYRKGKFWNGKASAGSEGRYRYQITSNNKSISTISVKWSYIDNEYLIDEVELVDRVIYEKTTKKLQDHYKRKESK